MKMTFKVPAVKTYDYKNAPAGQFFQRSADPTALVIFGEMRGIDIPTKHRVAVCFYGQEIVVRDADIVKGEVLTPCDKVVFEK